MVRRLPVVRSTCVAAGALLWAVAAGFALGFAPGKEAALPAVSVAEVALKQFAAWDADQDGTLSAEELDGAILNPEVKGANAAAAVALRKYLGQEAKAGNKVKLTREVIDSDAVRSGKGTYKLALSDTDAAELDEEGKGDVSGEKGEKKQKTVMTPQALFDRARRTMARPMPPLFEDGEGHASGLPVMSRIHQGPLGDCYLVAVLGEQVHVNAQRLATMLVRKPGEPGTYVVNWGDGSSNEVAVTDGDRAMGGASTGGGMWIRVVEKALALRKLPEDEQDSKLTTEAIGGGGNQRQIMRLMTGHAVKFAELFSRKHEKGATAEEIEAKLKTLRPVIVECLAKKRLMCLGTPGGGNLPPGIAGKHVYALIGYDEKTDVLKVWNPWGERFTPKGEPGLAHGYLTRDGVFEVPFTEAARCFGGLSYETGDPAEKETWFKSQKEKKAKGEKN